MVPGVGPGAGASGQDGGRTRPSDASNTYLALPTLTSRGSLSNCLMPAHPLPLTR